MAVLLYLLLSLPLLIYSGFFNEILGLFEPAELNYTIFISFYCMDLICTQKSNLTSSSSFRIPEHTALRSDRTHSWFGILSPDDPYPSDGVIIFVRQGQLFFEFSTTVSLLDLYSHHVRVNILQNNSYSLSIPNIYTQPICSYLTDGRTD